MSGMRDFVTGADACGPSDGAGPSNAASSLAGMLLGGRAKHQERIQELPGAAGPSALPGPQTYRPQAPGAAAEAAAHAQLPGQAPGPAPLDVGAYLRGLPAAPPPRLAEVEGVHAFLDRQHEEAWAQGQDPRARPGWESAGPRRALAPFLQAFMDSGKTAAPFQPMRLPALPLSVPDQVRIRDRATIMARQMFAERGGSFADEQVHKLLASLNIDAAQLPAAQGASWDAIFDGRGRVGPPARMNAPPAPWLAEFEQLRLGERGPAHAWAAEHAAQQRPQTGERWAEEHAASLPPQTGERWAEELARETLPEVAPGQWAEEFDAETGERWVNEFQGATVAREADVGTREHSRRLAETLAASSDPKIRNSEFLRFVSKMSRGELVVDGNAVKEVTPTAAAWAEEFGREQLAGGPGSEAWADQFAAGMAGGLDAAWEEGAAQLPGGWEEEYARSLEQVHSGGNVGDYVMAPDNPFFDDPNSFQRGRELFRQGVLSEAVLALEAECQRQPTNAEAWSLLGTVQAENDDDQQAIAAMNRALVADPRRSDVLLSLGVAHTNELDSSEAVRYLSSWVRAVGGEGAEALPPPGAPEALPALLERLRAQSARPEADAEAFVALGVAHSLARGYDSAVKAFRRALELRPHDYSLWNKLGATLANSSRSGEALDAYRRALDLKPNYMRAWTNMGIGFANLGEYERSASFYVRALSLNPRATSVWSYLRTSLTCAGRADLMEHAAAENLQAMQHALPLQG